MFERVRSGDAEPKMLGETEHGREKLDRIVHRKLSGLLDRVARAALRNVVIANDVDNEDDIENPSLQRGIDVRSILRSLYCQDRPRAWNHKPGD